MKKVFISYRRDDSAAMAGRLYDSLCARFGQGSVFFDVDTITSGNEFEKEIASCLASTGVLLAIMGQQWHRILLERSAKLPTDDYVAIEIRSAHSQKVPIVPVLVGKHAKLEFERFIQSDSPLAGLIAPHQAIEVDEGRDYRNHVDRLIRDIEKVLGISRTRKLRIIGTVAMTIVAGVIGFCGAHYAFRVRYKNLPEGARSIGLTSIEDRNDPGQAVPPEVVFRRASKEVFISGVSCYRTFDQHRGVIDELVIGGKDVFVLIMDPDAPDVAALSERLRKPVDNEIRQVITIIKNNRNILAGKIHLRLMSRMPPFTAVMVDGDIATGNSDSARSGMLRVQPMVSHNVQHQGIILEFGRSSTGVLNGFDFYADDLRKQWTDASSSDAKVAEMLRVAQ